MLRSLIVGACLALTACGLTSGWQPVASKAKIEAASANSVVIGPVSSVSDNTAIRLATEHCKQYGLNARFARMISSTSVHYQCWP